MYADEEVDNNEAKNLAKELNAIFVKTSAKSSINIEELFIKLGKKFLNKNGENLLNDDGINEDLDEFDTKANNNTNGNMDEIQKLKDEMNKYKELNNELKKEINILKNELNNKEKINEKLTRETINLNDKLDFIQKFNDLFKKQIRDLEENNKKLKNELELIKNNKINYNNNQNVEENNNNENIDKKNNEINKLTNQLKNDEIDEKKSVDADDIIVINFISSDQSLNCALKCLKTDIFAKVEEKLYYKYEEYRETNNNFFVNEKLVLRFKKLCENDIKDGDNIRLEKIESS